MFVNDRDMQVNSLATSSIVLSAQERSSFRKQGYLVRKLLDEADICRYLAAIEKSHHDDFAAQRMSNIQFLQPGKAIRGLQNIICQQGLMHVCQDLLGESVIVDGASLFYAQAGVDYRQGWHRDVLQVPDEEIDQHWFSKDYHYNYVQVNIPLTIDGCLWIVPGSQHRQLNREERTVFGDTEKMTTVDAQKLAGGRQILLQAGEAVFYNNYAVHRGWGGVLEHKRITVHLGFHSACYPPTLHFGVLDHTEYTPGYLASLEPAVREALRAHLDERARHPEVDAYHASHQAFIKKEFKTT